MVAIPANADDAVLGTRSGWRCGVTGRHPILWRWASAVALMVAAVMPPSTARADGGQGTYFLLDGALGVGTSPYRNGEPAWGGALAIGPTLGHRRTRLRWHLLGNLQLQFTPAGGGPSAIERTDVGLFLSQRTVLPVVFPLRIYLETGFGARYGERRPRDPGLGLTLATWEPLVVLALGVQLRWTERWSVGLRGAWEPLAPAETVIDLGIQQRTRGTLALTVGVHF